MPRLLSVRIDLDTGSIAAAERSRVTSGIMRALRWHGNRDIRVDTVPEPKLRPGWVKVKNAWCGVCGSDLTEWRIGPKNSPYNKPHVLTGETLPTVCGHEFSGTVEALGEGVTDLEIGQKVAVFPVLTDGTCYWCEKEAYGLCYSWGFLGYSGFGGGMAEYVCVERKSIHKIPEHIGLDVAALVEPLAVGWHAVKVGKVGAGDHCLVLGAGEYVLANCDLADQIGPIGVSVVHALKAHGVSAIVVSEPSALRAAQAKASGATHLIDPTKEDVPETCRKQTNGFGMHAVFDCAGLQVSFDAALGVRAR